MCEVFLFSSFQNRNAISSRNIDKRVPPEMASSSNGYKSVPIDSQSSVTIKYTQPTFFPFPSIYGFSQC